MARADGIIKTSEQEVINAYTAEMHMPNIEISSLHVDDIHIVLDELARITTPKIKRCILLELIGVICVDGIYAPEEEELFEKVVEAFAISCDEKVQAKKILKDYIAVCSKLYKYVEEGIAYD